MRRPWIVPGCNIYGSLACNCSGTASSGETTRAHSPAAAHHSIVVLPGRRQSRLLAHCLQCCTLGHTLLRPTQSARLRLSSVRLPSLNAVDSADVFILGSSLPVLTAPKMPCTASGVYASLLPLTSAAAARAPCMRSRAAAATGARCSTCQGQNISFFEASPVAVSWLLHHGVSVCCQPMYCCHLASALMNFTILHCSRTCLVLFPLHTIAAHVCVTITFMKVSDGWQRTRSFANGGGTVVHRQFGH